MNAFAEGNVATADRELSRALGALIRASGARSETAQREAVGEAIEALVYARHALAAAKALEALTMADTIPMPPESGVTVTGGKR